jgi:hypothetical protein
MPTPRTVSTLLGLLYLGLLAGGGYAVLARGPAAWRTPPSADTLPAPARGAVRFVVVPTPAEAALLAHARPGDPLWPCTAAPPAADAVPRWTCPPRPFTLVVADDTHALLDAPDQADAVRFAAAPQRQLLLRRSRE